MLCSGHYQTCVVVISKYCVVFVVYCLLPKSVVLIRICCVVCLWCSVYYQKCIVLIRKCYVVCVQY